MKGKYKVGSTYCWNCDREVVSIGKKCKACNSRMIGSKSKKPNINQILKDIEDTYED